MLSRQSVPPFIVLAILVSTTPAASQRTMHSDSGDRRDVSITVYNGNFGLVREIRSVRAGVGQLQLEFRDVSTTIQPETVHIRSLTGGLEILEQNYQYDLLSPEKLLEKYLGRTVTVYRVNEATGREEAVPATVLSVNGGAVLQIGSEITYGYPGRFAFPEIPDNLIAMPTLTWSLVSDAEEHDLEVSYLTGGLQWKADYVLVVNADDTNADLTGWVTLENQSGASYQNAQLKLVAGDVQRAAPRVQQELIRRAVSLNAEPQFQENQFFEYHLYTLQRRATVLNNEQKQVTLLEADRLRVRKRLILRGHPFYYRAQLPEPVTDQKFGVFLELENSQANGMGMPLPAGTIRVYKADGDGAQQFIGEDNITHTPRDEKVAVRLGDAFDVLADRRQLAWRPLGTCRSESEWAIAVRNHKDTPETVEVVEGAGGQWEITSSSHAHARNDASSFQFTETVPARGSITITYAVRNTWC